MSEITVTKRDHHGQPILSYRGNVLARGDNWICVEAVFSMKVADIGVMTFRRGDVMTEWFYTDRCYNVFKVQDGHGTLKGWYCNITRPAEINEAEVAADDLALDVFVAPDGTVTVLDADEFEALDLSQPEREAALAAVQEIRTLTASRSGPFSDEESET